MIADREHYFINSSVFKIRISTTPPGPGSHRTCWQPGRVGGHARPTCAPSFNAIFYLLRTGCQWRLLPRSVPAPGTAYRYFRAWKDAGVLTELQGALHEQARLKPRLPALPCGGHPGRSVGQDRRARRHPWFRWAQTGQRAQTHRAHRVCFVPAVGRQSR
jgi:hypothetical protein